MREHIVRGASIAVALALLAAGCSSSSSKAKNPKNVFPTTRIPTTVRATTPTTKSRTTTPGQTTVPGSPTGPSTSTTTAGPATTPITPPTVPGPPPTFQGGIVMRWKLALDFRSHPGRNPFASYRGGPAVWSLREGQTRARNGLYPLLPTFSSTFQSQGLSAWHDNGAGCPNLPAIGINTVDAPINQCSASIAGNAAFLEPDASHIAVVGFMSPFTGKVSVSHNAVADLDGTCGDGVSYYVELGTQQIASVRVTSNNAANLPPTAPMQIVKGQSLYFIVDPGPADDAGCDATQLAVTVDHLA